MTAHPADRLTPATSRHPHYANLPVRLSVRTSTGISLGHGDTPASAAAFADRLRRTEAPTAHVFAQHIAPDQCPVIAAPNHGRHEITEGCQSTFWVADPTHDLRNAERALAALADDRPRAWQTWEQAGYVSRQQHHYFNDAETDWFGVRVACERPLDGTVFRSHAGACRFRDWAWNWRTGRILTPAEADETTGAAPAALAPVRLSAADWRPAAHPHFRFVRGANVVNVRTVRRGSAVVGSVFGVNAVHNPHRPTAYYVLDATGSPVTGSFEDRLSSARATAQHLHSPTTTGA